MNLLYVSMTIHTDVQPFNHKGSLYVSPRPSVTCIGGGGILMTFWNYLAGGSRRIKREMTPGVSDLFTGLGYHSVDCSVVLNSRTGETDTLGMGGMLEGIQLWKF